MGIFEMFETRARRHANEDGRRAEVASIAEPLASRLLPGRNYFSPEEYRALAVYLHFNESGDDAAFEAIERGSFKVGSVEVVRSNISGQRWVSAEDLADLTGHSRRHMSRLLSDAKIGFRLDGQKKLFSFTEIECLRWYELRVAGHDGA